MRVTSTRHFSHSAIANNEVPYEKLSNEEKELLAEPRASDVVDVCIVGGGPAGLATAIKLKQLDNETGSGELRVVVLEKAGDFGSHTVSGAVIEPGAFRELFPNSEYTEQTGGIPLPPDMVTKVTHDAMKYLTEKKAYWLPEPPQLANKNKNYIVSLSNVVRYLSEQAEELGVELYPGIAVSELVYNEMGDAIKGVATKDLGISKKGVPKSSFERGMEFHARVTVLAEGCHGSLTKEAVAKFDLRKDSDPQTYGLGIKEVWEVDPKKFNKGYVGHSLGFPLSTQEYGGGFMYHFGDGLVAVGLVIGLDYANPYVSPYLEFQKMKTHPYYANVLEGGKCISYAARTLNEGGYQSIPQLHFPGGILVGCSAGFVNVPKIKGTHTAIKSGIVAAQEIFNTVKELDPVEEETFEDEVYNPIDLVAYENSFKDSWAYKELYAVRNCRPAFNTALGFLGGLSHSGFSTMISFGKEPWTLGIHHTDADATHRADNYKPKEYPKPDGKLTFDILTSVSRTGTHHDEDERCHLRIPNQDYTRHAAMTFPAYKGIEQRFCPAGVYEFIEDDSELGIKFQINNQNCIHCKTCDIKSPMQDVTWTVPEGGDGPKYYMT